MPYKDIEKKRAYQRKKTRLWREKHPEDNRRRCKATRLKYLERYREMVRQWKVKNPELQRACQLVAAAKKRAHCTLDSRVIAASIKAGVCEITGLRFILTPGKPGPWSPSLDRIDGKFGYTPENTRVVVWLYNCAKNEFTDADVAILAEAIAKPLAEKIVPAITEALKKR